LFIFFGLHTAAAAAASNEVSPASVVVGLGVAAFVYGMPTKELGSPIYTKKEVFELFDNVKSRADTLRMCVRTFSKCHANLFISLTWQDSNDVNGHTHQTSIVASFVFYIVHAAKKGKFYS
jgi:hypothetical protein